MLKLIGHSLSQSLCTQCCVISADFSVCLTVQTKSLSAVAGENDSAVDATSDASTKRHVANTLLSLDQKGVQSTANEGASPS